MPEKLSSISEKIYNTYFVMALLESLLKSYLALVVILERSPPIELILQSSQLNYYSKSLTIRMWDQSLRWHWLRKKNPSYILILILIYSLHMITRRISNAHIVARKVTIIESIRPRRRTRSQES